MINRLPTVYCLLLSLSCLSQADYSFDQKGFTYKNDRFKINAGTMLQYDAVHARSDKTPINDGNHWRNQKLNITGMLGDNRSFKFGYDFNTETCKDAWLKDNSYGVSLGQFKSPVGMESQQSSRWWFFTEASMATMTTPQRFLGIKWQPVFEDQYLFALALQQANLNDDDSMSDKPLRASTRLVYSPFHKDAETLHIGGSFQWAEYKDENRNVSIGALPEAKFENMPKFGTTGTIKADNSQSGGLEAGYGKGSLTLVSEYVYHRINSKDTDDTYRFHGAYAQASYFLDNSTYRTYSLTNGAFGKPSSTDMTWELAARASWLDLEDKDITGGTKTNYTVGLNLHYNLNLKFALNYINANIQNGPGGDENPDMLIFRTQLAF